MSCEDLKGFVETSTRQFQALSEAVAAMKTAVEKLEETNRNLGAEENWGQHPEKWRLQKDRSPSCDSFMPFPEASIPLEPGETTLPDLEIAKKMANA